MQQQSNTKINILVLGNYFPDRTKNPGDELYKIAIPQIMNVPRALYSFRSIDTISAQDVAADRCSIIICGGGSILTHAFLQQLWFISDYFAGSIYALSADISSVNESDRESLGIFDHIFARSRAEYNLACAAIGSLNVTQLPDATMYLSNPFLSTNLSTNLEPSWRARQALGVTLSPRSVSPQSVTTIVEGLSDLAGRMGRLEIHLLSFAQADFALHQEVADGLSARGIPTVFPQLQDLPGPMSLYAYMSQKIDMVLTATCLGTTLALNLKKPLVALVDSIDSIDSIDIMDILSDFQSTRAVMQAATMTARELTDALDGLVGSPSLSPPQLPDVRIASNIVIRSRALAKLLIRPAHPDPLDMVLERCHQAIGRYLTSFGLTYDANQRLFPLLPRGSDYADVARIIFYCLTRSLNRSPLVGALASRLRADRDLDLHAAMAAMYTESWSSVEQPAPETYYLLPRSMSSALACVDPYVINNYKGYHRSGWDFVLRGLASMDAMNLVRHSDYMLDTYVDRTFHWGRVTLEAAGHLPYREPWLGILHHTFHEGYSAYNSTELFRNQTFLDSLVCCHGLVTLSEYLAVQVRTALRAAGWPNISVHSLTHPTETPLHSKFSMPAFLANSKRQVVQVGAWLRDPYAIYDLPLYENALGVTKAALRGKDMDGSMNFPGLLDVVLLRPQYHDESQSGDICRPSPYEMCRPEPTSVSRFGAGLFENLQRQLASVEVLDSLSNDAYDDLLSKNIIFLKLVDCSAVNTVIECIVRDTPLLVNRHPALEEVLGTSYPGFYVNAYHAASMAQDLNAINAIHAYVKRLNKDRFDIRVFVNRLQTILSTLSS